jgi:hypothetical protein
MTSLQTQYYSENEVTLGVEPGNSGSVARSSDHWTTEAARGTIKYSVPEKIEK